MRRFFLSMAAAVLCVALVATAQAGTKGGHQGGHSGGHNSGRGHSGGGHSGKGYSGRGHSGKGYSGRGHSRGGRSYRGKAHSHWSSTVWDKRYGCRLYFDPATRTYYYWCPPDDCYYPVDYCPYDTYSWDE